MGILIVEKENKSAELIYEIFIDDVKDLYFASDCIQASIAFRKYNPSIIIVDLDISFDNVIDLIETMKIENSKLKVIAIYSIFETKKIENNLEKYHINALIHKNTLNNYLYDVYKNFIDTDLYI